MTIYAIYNGKFFSNINKNYLKPVGYIDFRKNYNNHCKQCNCKFYDILGMQCLI